MGRTHRNAQTLGLGALALLAFVGTARAEEPEQAFVVPR